MKCVYLSVDIWRFGRWLWFGCGSASGVPPAASFVVSRLAAGAVMEEGGRGAEGVGDNEALECMQEWQRCSSYGTQASFSQWRRFTLKLFAGDAGGLLLIHHIYLP